MKRIAILAIFALAGCGDSVRSTFPPPELLTCAEEPVAPDLPARNIPVDPVQLRRDNMMLDYVLSWRKAWGDTCANVKGIAAWAKEVK